MSTKYGSIRPRISVFRRADALRMRLNIYNWSTFLDRATVALEKAESEYLKNNPSEQEKKEVAILEPVEN